jgi:uncharacterized protein (TIGR02679 family)
MTEPADARLHRLLGGDRFAALRQRLRRRYELAPPDGILERIRIARLAPEEHAALASLVGRPQRPADSLGFEIDAVDAVLRRAGIAASLRDALERLDGPIVNLAAARLRHADTWSDIVAGCGHPELAAFVRSSSGSGLLKRLARQDSQLAAKICRGADGVLLHLPAKGIARAQLAANTMGDAHALDDGQPVAAIVLAILRRRAPGAMDEPSAGLAAAQQDTEAVERRRETWARAGVLVNELARPALCLNLPAGMPPGDRWRRGEPAYLSLRSLLRDPPAWDVAGRVVHVCENPNLLAIAADRWGADCAPLVCTEGMPAAAQRCLLHQLVQAKAQLRYHGDFDWPGIRIGNYVVRTFGAAPWRFGAIDYQAAVRTLAGPAQPLLGSAVEPCWDRELATVMGRQDISIPEEAIAATLLPDLDDRSLKP